jgi:hypothetical protein
MTASKTDPLDEDMPTEIDFSQGTRGRFLMRSATMNRPVYLDAKVHAYLAPRAQARGIEVEQLVNELLRRTIELIEAAK